jgi:sugar fermentation stimulation protein A
MTGCYILVLSLERAVDARIGNRGRWTFPAGFYSYTGSGMGGIIPRLNRHLASRKLLHWHIDYFLQYANISHVVMLPSHHHRECEVHRWICGHMEYEIPVPRFGASDCDCPSHLIRYTRNPRVRLAQILRGREVD